MVPGAKELAVEGWARNVRDMADMATIITNAQATMMSST